MKHLKICLIAALTSALLISCNQQGQQAGNETPAGSTAVVNPAVLTEKIMTLSVSHHVKDFAAWTAGFFGHEAARQAAKLEVMGVFQDFEDPNFVSVTMKVGDMDAANQFMASEDLKNAMKKAGVTDEPEIKFYEFNYMDTAAAKTSDNRMFVIQKVEDYDAWRKVFDANDSTRKAAGISVIVIARNHADPNEVAVSASSVDMTALKYHVERPETREAMKKAGVVGEPSVMYAKKLAISVI